MMLFFFFFKIIACSDKSIWKTKQEKQWSLHIDFWHKNTLQICEMDIAFYKYINVRVCVRVCVYVYARAHLCVCT